jgi:hypothetical protein
LGASVGLAGAALDATLDAGILLDEAGGALVGSGVALAQAVARTAITVTAETTNDLLNILLLQRDFIFERCSRSTRQLNIGRVGQSG